MNTKIIYILLFLSSIFCCGQTKTITGTIFDDYLEEFSGARIKCTDGSTVSDSDGVFILNVNLPVVIQIYADGFQTEKITVTNDQDKIRIILKESSILETIVVSASRISESVFVSPVSISRLGLKGIRNTPSINYFNGLVNLKGVTVLSNSRLSQAINTRGFSDLQP